MALLVMYDVYTEHERERRNSVRLTAEVVYKASKGYLERIETHNTCPGGGFTATVAAL